MADDPLDDFAAEECNAGGYSRRIYRKGSGPAVIVIAEIPGITPKVAAFARRVSDLGATVILPSLFGTDGLDPQPSAHGWTGWAKAYAGALTKVCVSREFTVFATGKSSPIADWLRELAAAEHKRCGGPGVGAVGMCLTGGFALAMATDERMLAPVLSQPSLPLGGIPSRNRRIDASDAELQTVKARCAAGLQVLGLRFEGDPLVTGGRFRYLKELLGDAFIGVELPKESANPEAVLPFPHSVLTEDLIDEPGEPTRDALHQVLDFFTEKLELTPGR